MLRKSLTVVAVMAAVAAGSVGVANASTPVAKTDGLSTCTATNLTNCIGTGTGLLGGLGLGGLLGLGGNDPGDHHHHFPGGNFGGRFGGGFGNRFGGTFWQNPGGVILPYSSIASSCGCSGSPVGFGYTQVLQPAQVEVVPVGAVATGDGSCLPLSSVDWNRPGWNRGVRFFRR